MVPSPSPIPGPLTQAVSSTDGNNKAVSYQASQPRNSMSVTNTKGLLNMPGQNNCFLNSAVQVLWHLDIFRRSFRELSGHACMAESCIFCALKELFAQFQYSHESALPPDALRQALAKTFCDQRRFQLGFMDDAAECFENILLRIHVHIASQGSEDMCGDLRCIPHQKFAMTLVEQLVCHNCGRRSEPLPFTQMVHYVATSALCAKAQEITTSESECFPNDSFGKLLKLAGEMGEVRKCPGECGSKINVKKTLMNHPEIVSVGLVWDSECPSIQHITDVFCNIGTNLQLQDMFHAVVDCEWARTTYHHLVGVVTYYGKHYSTFFFHSKLRVWIYFDDATVREIGPSWEQVVEKCQRGHFQPLLLLFATPDLCSVVPPSTQNDTPVTPKKDLMESGSTLTPRQAVMQQYNIFMNSLQNGGNVSCRNTHMSAKHCTSQENYLSSHYPENDGLHGKSEPSSSKCCHCGRFLSSATCVCSQKQTQSSSTTSEYANLPPSVFKHFSHDSKNLSKLNETALPFALPIAQTVRNNTIQKNLAQSSNSPKSHPVFNASMPQGYNPEFETKETASLCKTSSLVYGEGDPDSTDAYISRKAVENVLHLQKIQQHQISLSRSYNHGVAGNRNSSSSLESFDNAGKLANKTEREPHTMHGDSIRTRRDSGNWSSDHNSSSSLSTTSENCFFPATPSKKTTLGLKKLHSPTKAKLPDYSCVNSSDHGYDSYSVSSSDSYPSVGGSPIKLDPHLTRIPEDLQGPSDPEVLNKKLQIITEESTGPPDCDKLCAEADLLLAKSHDKEKEGDLIMAALLSDSAAARARAAMDAPYNNPHSLVSAKMKHSTCVMRSSCLYRRIKDDEIDERRKQKGFSGHHSRQSSRDSTHSRHSHQNNKDKTHSKHSNKGSNQQVLEESEAFGKNVEIYGTLPKKGSRRKLLASPDSTRVKDEQVYKDFLDKQRKNISICNNSSEDVGKSGKSGQKVESVKSKSEHSNEKLSNRLMHGCASPKSPTYKKQDISLVTASEDPGSGTNIVKRSSPKQSYPSHLFSSHLTAKNTDVSCDDVVHDGLLSPVNSSSKKQHKIKRKLIGGFMKQKNRSLPDLREDQSVSDSLDRSFDDTSLQMSPTLMLPNGTLKKLECQTDSARSTVPRGFHQPHYAFIKKDLSHRPLLVKVNPPNVQASVLNNSKSKLMRTLPSLPKKYESSAAEINHKPSKIPFASFVPKKETSAQAPLSPLKSLEILPPPTVRPLRNSSIPILTQQSVSMSTGTKSVTDTPTHPVTNQASAYFSEDLPPPSNPFLAELQARRRQIIGQCEKKKENAKANEVVSEPQPRAPGGDAQSQLSEFYGNNDGVFWLQELQFKQHQMLQKPNSQVKPLFRTEKEEIQESESKELNAQTSESLASVPIPKGGEPEYLKCPDDPKPATVSSSTLSPYAKNSGDTSKCSPKIKNISSSSSSVKDLASRFEKVLNKTQISNYHTNSSSPANVNPQSQTSSENHNCTSRSTGSSGACDQNHSLSFKEHIRSPQQNERTTEMQLHVQKQKTSEPLHSPQAEENECKESVLPPIHDACINESEPKATLCENGIHPSVRPQQPPDYETALQRLEFIRTAPLSETPEGKTLEELKLPSFGISSDVPAPVESSKRKQGPKKTVTFSDKVVLVACADFEDDFLPNPLLERVYQQHSETGGSETLDLCLSSDFSSNYPNENALVPCDTIPCAAPRPGGEMKLTSQSVSTSHGSVPCHLCHTKYVTTPTEYCTDCEFYMSRFRP